MLLLTLIILITDIYFQNGAISGFYICVILMSYWIEDDWIIIGTTVLSIGFTFLPYFVSHNDLSFLLISRILTMSMIAVVSFLIAKGKETEKQLRRSKETLELRVLARTASSEAKSRRLEQQIKILQTIRQGSTDASFVALDEVISNLRDLSIDKE
jgi:hypothetical protein